MLAMADAVFVWGSSGQGQTTLWNEIGEKNRVQVKRVVPFHHGIGAEANMHDIMYLQLAGEHRAVAI
jgi:predicted ATPase